MKHLPVYNQNYIELLQAFKKYLTLKGYAKSSTRSFTYYVREFLHRCERNDITDTMQITSRYLVRYENYLKKRPNVKYGGRLSESSIVSRMYTIRLFTDWLLALDIIKTDPFGMLRFRAPKSRFVRRIIGVDRIKLLYHACDNLRDRAVLGLYYGCGLRKNEGAALNVSDVNFRENLLYIRSGKGKKRRVIPLTNRIKTDLENYYLYVRRPKQPEEQALMINDLGRRMSGDSMARRLKAVLKAAGIGDAITLHSLRHSIATHLLESGLSIEQVRDFLGHSCLESTQIYTRVGKTYLCKHINT